MNGKRRRRLGTVVGVTALLAALAVPTSLPASADEVPNQVWHGTSTPTTS